MIFRETPLKGAFLIEPAPIPDNRGFFARLYCAATFRAHGITDPLDQISMSFNTKAETLRGMHYQKPPHAEAKLIRVTRGAIYDVIVDLRRGSPDFGRWIGVELSAENRHQLFVPKGFAHGFQTLAPETEVLYHISVPYVAEASTGVRWNDPDLAIRWPAPQNPTLSERDAALPSLAETAPLEV